MLQNDSAQHAGGFRRRRQRFSARDGNLDRLFDQDVFAGSSDGLRDRQMRARRGEDQNQVETGSGEQILLPIEYRRIPVLARNRAAAPATEKIRRRS